MNVAPDMNSIEMLDQEDLLKLVKSMVGGGVFVNFHGKRSAMEIAKRVQPRVTRRLVNCTVELPSSSAVT